MGPGNSSECPRLSGSSGTSSSSDIWPVMYTGCWPLWKNLTCRYVGSGDSQLPVFSACRDLPFPRAFEPNWTTSPFPRLNWSVLPCRRSWCQRPAAESVRRLP